MCQCTAWIALITAQCSHYCPMHAISLKNTIFHVQTKFSRNLPDMRERNSPLGRQRQLAEKRRKLSVLLSFNFLPILSNDCSKTPRKISPENTVIIYFLFIYLKNFSLSNFLARVYDFLLLQLFSADVAAAAEKKVGNFSFSSAK